MPALNGTVSFSGGPVANEVGWSRVTNYRGLYSPVGRNDVRLLTIMGNNGVRKTLFLTNTDSSDAVQEANADVWGDYKFVRVTGKIEIDIKK